MKTLVPPPLFGDATGDAKPNIIRTAPKGQSPFDAAFLRRVYRSMLLFGIVMTVLAAFAFPTVVSVGSFVGGLLLAAVMLRAQEVSVRSMLKPASHTGGFDAKLLLVLLLPIKFLAIGVLLWFINSRGWLQLAPFGLGFFAAQLVLGCQVAGLLLGRVLARK